MDRSLDFRLIHTLSRSLLPAFIVVGFLSLVPGIVLAQADTRPAFLRQQSYDTPLDFVGIGVKNLTEHSARIVWETNHPASARVRFGRSKKSSSTRSILRKRAKHSVRFDDLAPGTLYGFQVYAWDGSGHRIKSQPVTFTTKGTAPPRFKRVWVTRRSLQGGTIRWNTNIPTTAVFRSGYDTPLQYKTVQDTPSRYHAVRLNNFHPDRRILYRIMIEDTRGRTARSGLRSFRSRENNVAWNKPVWGSFDQPIFGVKRKNRGDTSFIDRINDDVFGYETGTANSGNPADTTQWFIVDLQQLYRPDTAVLLWRSQAHPRRYHILGSTFGTKWDTLAANIDARDGVHRRSRGGIMVYENHVSLNGEKKPIRYVKVKIPKGAPYFGKFPSYKFVQLSEFKLFPKEKTGLTGDTVPEMSRP